jgi:hypothetical protein
MLSIASARLKVQNKIRAKQLGEKKKGEGGNTRNTKITNHGFKFLIFASDNFNKLIY